MIIEVNIFGSLKNMVEYSQDLHKVELKENATIGTLIQLLGNFMNPEIKKLMDSELDGRVSNFLILLNDREISIYDGLQTSLRDKDIVTIIPVSHGG